MAIRNLLIKSLEQEKKWACRLVEFKIALCICLNNILQEFGVAGKCFLQKMYTYFCSSLYMSCLYLYVCVYLYMKTYIYILFFFKRPCFLWRNWTLLAQYLNFSLLCWNFLVCIIWLCPKCVFIHTTSHLMEYKQTCLESERRWMVTELSLENVEQWHRCLGC